MPQLLIDTDSESVDTLRDTVQLLNAICARRERLGQSLPDTTVVVAEPTPDPAVVFAGNPPSIAESAGTADQLPEGTTLVQKNGMIAAVPPAASEAKPKRTRKPRAAAAPAAAPAATVPLPPVVAQPPYAPTITPAIAARIAEHAPAPPPAPLALVGEAPPAAPGVTFRDVMLAITQGLQGGKLTNAEVTAICKQNGIDGPTALPAQPMLNGAILAAINALVASKG